MLEIYRTHKRLFLANIKAEKMPGIERISKKDNPYLWPYYLQFIERMEAYPLGIFIIDPRGVYTPIEDGECGVIHVERLPIVDQAVYGLTDLNKSAILREDESDDRVIIFQGVFLTRTLGWRFIDNSFQVKPIAGIRPLPRHIRLIQTRDGSPVKKEDLNPVEAAALLEDMDELLD